MPRAAFVYVAFLIDAHPRKIVGRRVSTSAHAGFVLDALEQAVHERRPSNGIGLVHHSDRGSQYLSIRHTERLAEAGIDAASNGYTALGIPVAEPMGQVRLGKGEVRASRSLRNKAPFRAESIHRIDSETPFTPEQVVDAEPDEPPEQQVAVHLLHQLPRRAAGTPWP